MLKSVSKDLPASFVVFLVALPLSLGIALASGAPVKAGLIAAVCGGIVVGLTGGAPLQVSGPAAGLTVMVYAFIQKFGFEATCAITIAAGLLQLAFGTIGAAQLTLIISPAVIHAMLAGIGILISLGQLHVLLGHAPKGSATQNILGLVDSVQTLNPQALLIGVLTLGTILLWNRFLSKKVKAVPASLVAVAVGTLTSVVLDLNVPRVVLSSRIFDKFSLPQVDAHQLGALVFAAMALALVASAESLLCAIATDKLHSGKRANLNRELMAQGLGNAVSGLLGGLPITGVIVRSSANISAGAKSNLSAIMHGLWIFLFATFFSGFLNRIPLAALAGLLIHVGVSLVKIREIKVIAKFHETLIYFVTLAGVVFINLLWGIGIGFGLAVGFLLWRLSNVKMSIVDDKDGFLVEIKGALSFLSVPELIKCLQTIPTKKRVEIRFKIEMIDHAAVEALRDWKVGYEKQGGRVIKESLDTLWAASRSEHSTRPKPARVLHG